jgi:signal transduction histidine kinase
VAGDETQLEQVFLNLSLNAAEAMPDGGQLKVTTRSAPSPDGDGKTWVEVQFADTGRGMTKEEQQGVFKSLLKTSKQKGTGIGLAIVGRIIEAHRGKIELRSARGKGTSIRILLPAM